MSRFKHIVLVCFVFSLFLLMSLSASAEAIPGDVNGDGEVNIRDAAYILRYIKDMPVECVNETIDTNGDGEINAEDARAILRKITEDSNIELKMGDNCEHELTYFAAIPSTCESEGSIEYWYCDECFKLFKDDAAKTLISSAASRTPAAHKLKKVAAKAPTLTEDGNIEYWYCTRSKCEWMELEGGIATNRLYVKIPAGYYSEGFEYDLMKDGNYAIIGIGTCTDTDIVIPVLHEGKLVTLIAKAAFNGNTEITSIKLHHLVTHLDPQCFSNCTSLVRADLSGSLPYLQSQLFKGCVNLTEVIIPSSVKEIHASVFEGCKSLENIDIPEGVTTIRVQAFANCTKLTSIHIPASVTSITGNVFNSTPLRDITVDPENPAYHVNQNCLIETATKTLVVGSYNCKIPRDGSVTSIGVHAFYGRSGLTSISVPKCVTSIGDFAFYNCKKLKTFIYEGTEEQWNSVVLGKNWNKNCAFNEIGFKGNESLAFELINDGIAYAVVGRGTCTDTEITIPAMYNGLPVTGIWEKAFENCSDIVSVTIEEGVIYIGNWAFSGCKNLKNVVIPNGVYSIGYSAFRDCKSINRIVIPGSVKTFGDYAFYNCSNLYTFVYDSPAESLSTLFAGKDWRNNTPFTQIITSDEISENGLAYELNSDGTGYKLIGIGVCNEKNIVIPETYKGLPITEIGTYAFCQYTDLLSVEIPDSVTTIDFSAFFNCSNLSKVVLGNNVTEIGWSAFQGCTSLKSIVIPDTITEISNFAFADCTNLENINLSDHITSIGISAYARCTSLTEVHIPANVTLIEFDAFSGCSNVERMTVDVNNPVYHSQNNCIIDTNAKKLVSGCKTSIIPDDGSVTSIGEYAFFGSSNLISIAIPECVTSIGKSAFNSCTALKQINIPNSITFIDEFVFFKCTNLESLEIPSSVTSIGMRAFYNSKLTTITYGGTKEQWEVIIKGSAWNQYCPLSVIHCTDGDVEAK